MPAAVSRRRARLSAAWQIPAGAAGGIALAVLLGLIVMLVGGQAVLDVAGDVRSPGQAMAWGLGPWMLLGVVTMAGSVAGVSVVAVLVRDLLAGQPTRLRTAWGSTWRALPKILVLVVAAMVALPLCILAAIPLSLVFLVRSCWLLRSPSTRRRGRRGLYLAVPSAVALAVIAALPVVWAGLVALRPWREAVASAFRQSLLGRLSALGGVLLVSAVFVGLSWCGARWVDHPESLGGATGLLGMFVVELVLVGAALGLLGHRRGEPPTDPARLLRTSPGRVPRRGFWGNGKVASVAVGAIISLLAPLAPGLLLATAQAAERALVGTAALSPDGAILVDTLADEADPAAGECVDDGEPCSLRAAIRAASEAGGSSRVRFAVDGRIHLSGSLEIAAGTTVEADGHAVTVDAHHGFRAIQVEASGGGGEDGSGPVTLQGFTVTGGRSEEGGAGSSATAPRYDCAR